MRSTGCPRPGMDGWIARTRIIGAHEESWLERTSDAATGHVEYAYELSGYQARVSEVARTATCPTAHARPAAQLAHTAVRTADQGVTLSAVRSDLTVNIETGALRTIR